MPRKSQLTEEQIIKALQEVAAGTKDADACRRLGVTGQTGCRRKVTYCSKDVSDPWKLKAREDERRKL